MSADDDLFSPIAGTAPSSSMYTTPDALNEQVEQFFQNLDAMRTGDELRLNFTRPNGGMTHFQIRLVGRS